MTRKLVVANKSECDAESKPIDKSPSSSKTTTKCKIITSFEELGNLKARSRIPIDIHLVSSANPTITTDETLMRVNMSSGEDCHHHHHHHRHHQEKIMSPVLGATRTTTTTTLPPTVSASINFSSLIAVSKEAVSHSSSSSSSSSPNSSSSTSPAGTNTTPAICSTTKPTSSNTEQPVKYFSFMTTNKLFSNYTSQSTLKHQHPITAGQGTNPNQQVHHNPPPAQLPSTNNHSHYRNPNPNPINSPAQPQQSQQYMPVETTIPAAAVVISPKSLSSTPKETTNTTINNDDVNIISCSLSTSSSNSSSGVDSGCCSSSLARSSILSSQSSDYSTSGNNTAAAAAAEVERAETASTNSAASCSFSSDTKVDLSVAFEQQHEKERVKTLCEKIYSNNAAAAAAVTSSSSSAALAKKAHFMMISNLTQETNSLDRGVKTKQSTTNVMHSKRSDKILTVLFDYEAQATNKSNPTAAVFAVKQGEQVKVIRDYDDTYYLVAAIATGRIGFIPKDYTVDLREIRKRVVKQQQDQMETAAVSKSSLLYHHQSTMKAAAVAQCNKLTKL